MFDIAHRVTGVIQLINRKREPNAKLTTPQDFEEKTLAFDGRDEEYAQIVAQQAGIALENATLTAEIQKVFEGFVHASVTAIEQRDPTTSGHSFRVAKLTLGLAEKVDRIEQGPYREAHFSREQMKEIEYASLLHDFGKLGVRESVLVKAKKLYPWQMDILLERFEAARSSYEIDYLRRCLKYTLAPGVVPAGINADELSRERDSRMKQLDDYLNFILQANEPTVLPQGGFERLKDIADMKFVDIRGKHRPLLLSDELLALSVNRGSLTAAEFAEIQSHVTHTYNFLRKIPWGKALANIPEIALKHHEKLDGSGYPTSATEPQIPVQSRMMTIADIYDALTASDRPYKKAVPADRALEILHMEAKGGKMDTELLRIFIEAEVYKKVETH
jgi:HD-GYP domain-containing protein (c-di-GMP phosphodiesterase class II)